MVYVAICLFWLICCLQFDGFALFLMLPSWFGVVDCLVVWWLWFVWLVVFAVNSVV